MVVGAFVVSMSCRFERVPLCPQVPTTPFSYPFFPVHLSIPIIHHCQVLFVPFHSSETNPIFSNPQSPTRNHQSANPPFVPIRFFRRTNAHFPIHHSSLIFLHPPGRSSVVPRIEYQIRRVFWYQVHTNLIWTNTFVPLTINPCSLLLNINNFKLNINIIN